MGKIFNRPQLRDPSTVGPPLLASGDEAVPGSFFGQPLPLGRPPLASGDEAVPVTLTRRHVEMIDAATRFRLFADGVAPSAVTSRMIAKGRREWIGRLVEKALTAPVEVMVVAPAVGSATELRQVAEWMEAESRRLTSEAPTSVRRALAMRRDRGEVEDEQR